MTEHRAPDDDGKILSGEELKGITWRVDRNAPNPNDWESVWAYGDRRKLLASHAALAARLAEAEREIERLNDLVERTRDASWGLGVIHEHNRMAALATSTNDRAGAVLAACVECFDSYESADLDRIEKASAVWLDAMRTYRQGVE